MAVLTEQPGLKVEIVVDDVALREYEDDSDPTTGSKTTNYIEAMTDKNYAIRVTFLPKYPRINVGINITVDGTVVRKWYIAENDLFNPPVHEIGSARRSFGATRVRSTLKSARLHVSKWLVPQNNSWWTPYSPYIS
jgi:hypothetical protein